MKYKNSGDNRYRVQFMRATEELMDQVTVKEFMAFEGTVCHMLWYGTNPGIKKKFDKIFEKRGLYYEFGDHWNFTCYYIGE